MAIQERIRLFSEDYLERPLTKQDGVPVAELGHAEKRLGIALPRALREYYRLTGNCAAFNTDYNCLLSPGELALDGGFLIFMEENQEVVTWGIPVEELDKDDPMVWQRTNDPPFPWFSQEMTFLKFMATMLYWYRHGVMPEEGNLGA